MSISLTQVTTAIILKDSEVKSVEKIWDDFFFRIRPSDEEYVWNKEILALEGKVKVALDHTNNGKIYTGQTAAECYRQKKMTAHDEAIYNEKGLKCFADRFKQACSADARQAFNDYLGEAGEPGN